MRQMLFALLLLGGCATTPTALREEPPRASYASSMPTPKVERCLAEGLSYLGGPSITRDGDAETLTFGSGGITSLLVDLSPGAAVIRSGYPYGGVERKRVETCLQS